MNSDEILSELKKKLNGAMECCLKRQIKSSKDIEQIKLDIEATVYRAILWDIYNMENKEN